MGLSDRELGVVARSMELMKKLHNRTALKDIPYAKGFTDAVNLKDLTPSAGKVYLEGYDDGAVVQLAETYLKPYIPVVRTVPPSQEPPATIGFCKPCQKMPVHPGVETSPVAAGFTRDVQVRIAITQGYTGNFCASCGGCKLVRNGTCEKCEMCGETTGCS